MSDGRLVKPFQYARRPTFAEHGPRGYAEPQRYKAWLRDEFQFRCVYCLCRERWCPDGEDSFSVEHFRPQAWAAAEICDYDNLLYTCVRCNAAKRDLTGVLDPAQVPLADHLEILEDGRIRGLTAEGTGLDPRLPIGPSESDRIPSRHSRSPAWSRRSRCGGSRAGPATVLRLPVESSAFGFTAAAWRQFATGWNPQQPLRTRNARRLAGILLKGDRRPGRGRCSLSARVGDSAAPRREAPPQGQRSAVRGSVPLRNSSRLP